MPDPCHLPSEAMEPIAPFVVWFAEAQASEPRDANAMALASLDETGLPDIRVVLMKGVDARGFAFYTNFDSAKGRQLLAHRKAALNFHWKALGRQVRARGIVSIVDDADADAYFASRPRESQIGAWASDQSAAIESRAALEARVGEFERRFADQTVPRPPNWSGFRLSPLSVEFWHEGPYRLHDRILFTRVSIDAREWQRSRLSP